MAIWTRGNYLVTTLGLEVLSYTQAGNGALTITRVVAGEGRSTSTTALKAQTSVLQPRANLLVTRRLGSSTGSMIEVQLNNTSVQEAFVVNQVGIYASNPNVNSGNEVLYMIAQCDVGTGDNVPAAETSLITLNYSLYLIHGVEIEVNVSLSASGMVTRDEFDTHRHPNVTLTVDGFMSYQDKAILDDLAKKVTQSLTPTSTPTFEGATIGAVTILKDGTIRNAKFE